MFGIGELGDLAGLRIEAAEILLAETGKPDDAGLVHDDVVRRDLLAWQIVFRINHPRRRPFRAVEGFKRIFPLLRGAEIDGGEIVGRGAIDFDTILAALFHQAFGGTELRMDRQALLNIALHPWQDVGEEAPRVISRPYDSFEGVTADAVQQLILLPVAAGDACEPFAVRQLRRKVDRFAEPDIPGCGFLLGRFGSLDLDRAFFLPGRIELIANRANRDRVLTRSEPIGRERVAAAP